MPLKDNLKRVREVQGLSQVALSKKAGVSQQLISRLESGVDSTTKRLPEIARALSVSVYELDENFISDSNETVVSAPLISWVSAGQLETPDVPSFGPDDVSERRMSIGLDPKGHWIALRVRGDSMDRI